LKIFECTAHALILKTNKKKLNSKLELYWLVGYNTHTKAYMLLHPRTNKVILTHDVIFDETCIRPGSNNPPQLPIGVLSSKLNIPTKEVGHITWPINNS
jgi:hypothetical protein